MKDASFYAEGIFYTPHERWAHNSKNSEKNKFHNQRSTSMTHHSQNLISNYWTGIDNVILWKMTNHNTKSHISHSMFFWFVKKFSWLFKIFLLIFQNWKLSFPWFCKTKSSLSPDWADTPQPPFTQLATPKYLPHTPF